MIELYLCGMTHLNSKSHMDALRTYLSRTMLLVGYRLCQLHVLCNAIYMSLHHTHLYGSTHKNYHLDRMCGGGGGEREQATSKALVLYHMYVLQWYRVGGNSSRKLNLHCP